MGAQGRTHHEVESRIGRALLAGDIGAGDTIVLDAADGQLLVRSRHRPAASEPELADVVD